MKLTKENCEKALARLIHRLDFNAYKYCDGNVVLKERYKISVKMLEQLINEHFDNNMARTCQNLVSEIDKLEKALDKVIDEYADLYDSFVANGSDDFPYFNKEEYKEYLLN